MRIFVLVVAACVAFCGPASARDPVTGLAESFFNYRETPPPPGGDCGAIAAAVGPQSTWLGEFAGKFEQVNDRFRPFAASGCFDSALACEVWQQLALNYAYGAVTYARCRQGIPAAYVR